jgi:hypothetical protein
MRGLQNTCEFFCRNQLDGAPFWATHNKDLIVSVGASKHGCEVLPQVAVTGIDGHAANVAGFCGQRCLTCAPVLRARLFAARDMLAASERTVHFGDGQKRSPSDIFIGRSVRNANLYVTSYCGTPSHHKMMR